MSADFMVLATVTIAVGSTVGAEVASGNKPSIAPVLGGFAVGTVLLIGAMISPEVTYAFCWLIIVGALLINGTRIASAVNLIP